MSEHAPPVIPDPLTKSEAGAFLRCGEKKVERLLRDGVLEGHRIGSRVLISRSSVERLLGRSEIQRNTGGARKAG